MTAGLTSVANMSIYVHELVNVQPVVLFSCFIVGCFLSGISLKLLSCLFGSVILAALAQRFWSRRWSPNDGQGKAVFITGTSSGIGMHAALEFASQGFHVFATVRSKSDADRFASRNITPIIMDVRDVATIKSGVAEMRAKLVQLKLRLHAAVMNAGYAEFGVMESLPLEVMRRQYDTNVFGLHACCLEVVDLLRESATPTWTARLILVSSVVGRISPASSGAYCSTKYAVEAMGNCWRQELAPFNIDVVLIEPGAIATEFNNTRIRAMRSDESTNGLQRLPDLIRQHYIRCSELAEKMFEFIPFSAPSVTSHGIMVCLFFGECSAHGSYSCIKVRCA